MPCERKSNPSARPQTAININCICMFMRFDSFICVLKYCITVLICFICVTLRFDSLYMRVDALLSFLCGCGSLFLFCWCFLYFTKPVEGSYADSHTLASSKTPSVAKHTIGCVSQNEYDFSAVRRTTMTQKSSVCENRSNTYSFHENQMLLLYE